MKKTLFAGALGLALVVAPTAHAGTDLCSGHADYSDLPFGPNNGNRYITACGGDSGPDYGNSAVTPNVDTKPVIRPIDTGTNPPEATHGLDAGTYDDAQNVKDDDGLQGNGDHQGVVRPSPLFVPAL